MESSVVGQNIKRLREEQGFTQATLAKQMKVAEQFISALERGARNPGPKTMRNLCEVLGVTEDQIRFDQLTDIHRMLWKTAGQLTEDEAFVMLAEARKLIRERDKALIE